MKSWGGKKRNAKMKRCSDQCNVDLSGSRGAGLMMPKRSMKRILQFVSTLPCLEFLDLSPWDELSDSVRTSSVNKFWFSELLLILQLQMLRYLHQGIEVLNLSFTSITDRGNHERRPMLFPVSCSLTPILHGYLLIGLARLPTTLKGLYVEQTSVSSKGLRHLQRFEKLTALDLCSNQGFAVSHIRVYFRNTVSCAQ